MAWPGGEREREVRSGIPPRASQIIMKPPGHPVRTGQARRGRSILRFAGLTALSPSIDSRLELVERLVEELPGTRSGERKASKRNILLIVPLDPACKAGLTGHQPAENHPTEPFAVLVQYLNLCYVSHHV